MRGLILVAGLLLIPECWAPTGYRYLIITHDNFDAAVQPLAEWKHEKGMMCRVVRRYETGSSKTKIRNYIINVYNTWEPRPEFLLLVGSGYCLTAYPHCRGIDAIYTDGPYGDMTGSYLAELPVG